MKQIFSLIIIIFFVIGSQVFAQIEETHEFGATNTQYFIYSSGVTFEFIAENNMTVETVEVKSVLASASSGGTFYIFISIQDSLIANWQQYINNSTYTPYIHTKQVSYSLYEGDSIVYEVYGSSHTGATGGLLGINYVKLIGQEITGFENQYTPTKYLLHQNYPNPFNPTTRIKYSIPELSFVTLKVFDVLGNEIALLVNEEKSVGNYEVEFSADNLSSGTYFYRLQVYTPGRAGDPESSSGHVFVETKKMILLR